MIPQWMKTAYFQTVARLTVLNFLWRRIIPPSLEPGPTVLHLGCGPNYLALPGWVNIDGNLFSPKDLWLDVTFGLPFPDQSIDAIYAHHFLEHLREKGLRRILKESHRVLKPGRGLRLVTPDLRKAILAYLAGDGHFFSDWPDPRDSLGGKFNNYLLCRNQHRFMFDFEFLKEFLADAGFKDCREVGPGKSYLFPPDELAKISEENPENCRSLFVEAIK